MQPGDRDAMSAEATVPEPRAPARLGERTIRGTAIGLVGFGASQGFRLVSNMVLTRLLFPEAFGLMAIVRLLQHGLDMFSSVGIEPAIIRHERGDEALFLDTAFSIQIVRGLLLWLAASAAAVPISRFYDEPQLAMLIPAATAAAVITGFQSTKMIGLRRHLQLGRLVFIEMTAQVVTLAITAALAWFYPTVWALVVAFLVFPAIVTLLSYLAISGPRNRIRWDPLAAHQIFSFGKWILVSTLFTFLALQIDVVMLGKLIPMDELGVYSIAILVVAIPRALSGQIIQTILLPALAESHRSGHERLARNFARVRRVVLPGGLLALLGTVAVAPAFFVYLYAPEYHDAGWISQLSVLTLWFGFLQESSTRALLALGDARSSALANGVKSVATGLGCITGFASAGLMGLIVGAAAGALAGYLVIALRLRAESMSVFGMDMLYSVFGIALGLAIGLGAPLATHRLELAPELEPAATLVIGLLLIIPFASWTALRIRNELRGRHSSPPETPTTPNALH
jgi:O-antigen/teichoic acid export membrane protein